VLFHISTLVFMNIFFPYQLAMYLVFVDWDRMAAWLNKPAFDTKKLKDAKVRSHKA